MPEILVEGKNLVIKGTDVVIGPVKGLGLRKRGQEFREELTDDQKIELDINQSIEQMDQVIGSIRRGKHKKRSNCVLSGDCQ